MVDYNNTPIRCQNCLSIEYLVKTYSKLETKHAAKGLTLCIGIGSSVKCKNQGDEERYT